MGINLNGAPTKKQLESVLVEAMRADLGPAVEFLHTMSHKATGRKPAMWEQDPKSSIGKMLIRIHASDVLRPLAKKHFCHGKELSFINCCKGFIGKPPKNLSLLQVRNQSGHDGKADC